jgi:hypothetical protein
VALGPPQGTAAPAITDEAIRVRVGIDLSDLSARLSNEAARLFTDYSQQGLTGDALGEAVASALQAMFDPQLDRAGREATHEAFSLGRNLEAQAGASKVTQVVRSEVLDRNTCEPCSALDGTVVEMNSPDYFKYMPPNGCDGREQCRGLYLYQTGTA